MFLGKETYTVDDKGRLSIPAKFREVVGGVARLVVTRKVLDPCLEVYTEADWQRFMARLDTLSSANLQVRRYRRLVYSGAEICPLDRQGRILIPQHLREYAGLSREAVVNGNGATFEIWDTARWQAEMDHESDPDEMARSLSELGL